MTGRHRGAGPLGRDGHESTSCTPVDPLEQHQDGEGDQAADELLVDVDPPACGMPAAAATTTLALIAVGALTAAALTIAGSL